MSYCAPSTNIEDSGLIPAIFLPCELVTFFGENYRHNHNLWNIKLKGGAMYDNLKSLGITQPEDVDRYSLRQEANNDILKIYFRKDKGEFFAKSVKFKYPRQRKTVVADNAGHGYKEINEINPNLRYVIDELDQLCKRDQIEVDLKRKILDDLRHLESVVANKIAEIESDLEKLTNGR